MDRQTLITRKTAIEAELGRIRRLIDGRPPLPAKDYRELRHLRAGLVDEKIGIDQQLIALKAAPETAPEPITLMSLDFDGRRAWHLARGNHAEWLTDLLTTFGQDAPIVLTRTSLTPDQAAQLPPAFWNFPELD